MDTTKLAGKFEGIVKFDMSATNGGAVAGRLSHGTNRWGGEAVFVSASAGEHFVVISPQQGCCSFANLEGIIYLQTKNLESRNRACEVLERTELADVLSWPSN